MAGGHRVGLVADGAGGVGIVDSFKQTTVLHIPFGTAFDDGGLGLELDDGDGLVHQCREVHGLLVQMGTFEQDGLELRAGVVAVGLHGKGGQRHEVDAVALLQRGQIGIAQGES